MFKLGGIAAGVILVGLAGYGGGKAAHRIGDSAGAAAPAQVVSPPKGERQPSTQQSVSVASTVEGLTTILKIVPDGSTVKKGDVVCVLNATLFQDQLVNQRITVKMAEAAFLNAKLAREVAEIAVREYREGEFVSQFMDAEGDIKIAEAELSLADMEFKTAKADPSSGTLAIKRAEVAVLRARFTLEKAQSRKRLLKDYTSAKRIKELESAVKKVHADELARQATWELEVAKERKLERQIVNSTLTAPVDGRLRYQRATPTPGMLVEIAPGVGVREGQIIFSIEPADGSTTSKDKPPGP
jgi:hypothetical protein